ncbi:MAG: 3'-5' exonuclease [Endomicrobiales bacterium]|nr:3'-5' exonuclease [Endomicrobiales bacterium]
MSLKTASKRKKTKSFSAYIKNEPQEYAFLDVETTGMSPRYRDRICEIAVLKYRGKKLVEKFETLINPERPITCGASMVNGITDDMVKDTPKFSEIAQKLREMLEGSIIVCHNLPFDLGFLEYEFYLCDLALGKIRTLDTLALARRFFNFPSNRLGSIADFLSIKAKRRHRAMADAETTKKIFSRFLEKLPGQTIESSVKTFLIEPMY